MNLKQQKDKKSLLMYCVAGIFILVIIFNSLQNVKPVSGSISYTEFMGYVDDGVVDHVLINNSSVLIDVFIKGSSGSIVNETVINPNYPDFIKDLSSKNIEIKFVRSTLGDAIVSIMLSLPFTILIIFLIIYLLRIATIPNDMGDIDGNVKKSVVRFSDVAGMTEEKQEMLYTISGLKNAKELRELGVRPSKGVLLEGPPGVGKTLLAKAVAGEAGVKFFSYSGSDFVEMFAGLGALRIRMLYQKAMQNRPCVIFIDEIDAVGSKRVPSGHGGIQETNQTLVALLEKMDGMKSLDGILFIGATNRADVLDKALLRPGRFDKIIHIGPPKTKEDREDIVRVHLRGKILKEGVSLEKVAKLCFGLTGAEIESVLNDAVIESFREDESGVIDLRHVDSAVMKVYSKGIAKGKHTEEEMYRAAIHEIGHALMNLHLGRKVVKVSIQPYSSGIGGVTMVDGDTVGSFNIRSEHNLIGDIKVLYAGAVAEKVIFGDTSNGCANDLQKATELLKHMVGSYGMKESLVALNYLAIDNPLISANKDFLASMNELSTSIEEDVCKYLNQSSVKEKITHFADILVNDEVIYDFG